MVISSPAHRDGSSLSSSIVQNNIDQWLKSSLLNYSYNDDFLLIFEHTEKINWFDSDRVTRQKKQEHHKNRKTRLNDDDDDCS
jgi:hypothetical protein